MGFLKHIEDHRLGGISLGKHIASALSVCSRRASVIDQALAQFMRNTARHLNAFGIGRQHVNDLFVVLLNILAMLGKLGNTRIALGQHTAYVKGALHM